MRFLDAFWTVVSLGVLVLIAVEAGILVVVLILASLVLITIVLHRPDLLRDWVWFLAVIGFATGYTITGDDTPELEFYVVTAQVIPALFIALAIEIRGFMGEHTGEDRRPAVVVALALAFAEYECLRAVAHQDVDVAALRLVVGALVAAAVGLVLPVALGPPRQPVTAPPDREPRKLRWTELLAAAMLLLANRRRRD